jgi:hypothetical protein
MDVIKENIVKFIDTMIVDNYSKAHKFLEVLVQEKVKGKIKKAKNLKPFEKKGKTKAKKTKKKVVKENIHHPNVIDLTELLPDGSNALAALFDLKHYHGGQSSHIYGVTSSGKIAVEDISSLRGEVKKAIQIASKSGEIEHEESFKDLYKELGKIEQRFEDSMGNHEEFGDHNHVDNL